MEERHLAILRRHMVEVIAIYAELACEVLGKAALDERVMAAMGRVPRHAFVPAPLLRYAYGDMPLPIGSDSDSCRAHRSRVDRRDRRGTGERG